MTTTTNPANVKAGRVRVSRTNNVKCDALIGRVAVTTLADGTVVAGVITRVDGQYPTMVIRRTISGRWQDMYNYKDLTTRLDSVVELLDECGICGYEQPATSGHWTYCPAR
jgi:hypothetical protein